MPYLIKTTTYDKEKGYVDFDCPSCNESVRVDSAGPPYSGLTLVGCPYCRIELILRTKLEITYTAGIYPTSRSS